MSRRHTLVLLDPATAGRLVKLCGMLGSDHDGERASAAQMADRLVRSLGLSWRDIIVPAHGAEEPKRAPRWDNPVTIEEALEVAHKYRVALTGWEIGFVRDLRRKRAWRLSEKQNDILNELIEKCRVHAMAEAV